MSDADADWAVGVIWLTRRLRRPDAMLRDRVRSVRRGEPTPPSSKGDTAGGILEGCAADELGVVLVTAVVGFVIGPILLAVLFGAAEIVLLLVIAAAIPLGRVLFRQPWEVVARRGDEEHTWRIRGLRAARTLADEISQGLRLGATPSELAPAHRDADPPDGLTLVPRLYARREFRLLGRVLGALLGLGVGVGIIAAIALAT